METCANISINFNLFTKIISQGALGLPNKKASFKQGIKTDLLIMETEPSKHRLKEAIYRQ